MYISSFDKKIPFSPFLKKILSSGILNRLALWKFSCIISLYGKLLLKLPWFRCTSTLLFIYPFFCKELNISFAMNSFIFKSITMVFAFLLYPLKSLFLDLLYISLKINFSLMFKFLIVHISKGKYTFCFFVAVHLYPQYFIKCFCILL